MVPDHDEGADLPFCLGICFPAIWILFVEKGMIGTRSTYLSFGMIRQ